MIRIGLLQTGAFATAFYQRRICALYGEKFQINNDFLLELFPVNFDLINSYLPDGHDEIVEIIQPVLQMAGKSGITQMMVPNITLHEILDKMTGSFGFKWIHPITIGLENLKLRGAQRVSVLGTRHTMKRSYIRDHVEQAGMQVLDVTCQYIEVLDKLRLDVFAGRDRSEELEKILQDLSPSVDALVLACTELSLAAENTIVSNVVDLAKGQIKRAVEIQECYLKA